MQNRLKSAVVWTAILGQVILILALFHPELTDKVKILFTAVIEILTLFGVLNNPTDKNNF